MPPLILKKYKKWDSDRPTGDELYDNAKPIIGKSWTEKLKELKSLSEALNRRPLNRSERRQRGKAGSRG